jgi:hypothetical protein
MRLEANLEFGDVIVGNSSERTLRIYNEGNALLTVTGMTVPSGTPVVASWTSGTIAPGTSQASTIRFAPTLFQTYGGVVTVNADQTSGGTTTPISGRGVAAPRAPFSRTGGGNSVFDMPGDVTRLRIFGRWSGRNNSNFIVQINGRTVVNEILRSNANMTYEGVHTVPLAPRVGTSTVEIVSSGDIVEWRFTETQ